MLLSARGHVAMRGERGRSIRSPFIRETWGSFREPTESSSSRECRLGLKGQRLHHLNFRRKT